MQIKDSLGLDDDAMGHHDNGGIIRTKGADRNMSLPAGEWNRMTVKMRGDRLVVVLNGETVHDFDLAEAKPEGKTLHATGSLGIQDHGEDFWVRNIRVKRL